MLVDCALALTLLSAIYINIYNTHIPLFAIQTAIANIEHGQGICLYIYTIAIKGCATDNGQRVEAWKEGRKEGHQG